MTSLTIARYVTSPSQRRRMSLNQHDSSTRKVVTFAIGWVVVISLMCGSFLGGVSLKVPPECPECECDLDDNMRDIYTRLDQCLLENQ